MTSRAEAIVAASETLSRTRKEVGTALRRDPDYNAKCEANFAAWDAWEAALALPADPIPPPSERQAARERALVLAGLHWTAGPTGAVDGLVERAIAEVDATHPRDAEPAEVRPVDREALGRRVREVWIEWAREQTNPKPSWLVPWEGLSEPDREVDSRIGETLARMGAEVRPVDGTGSAILTALAEMVRHVCPESGPHNAEEAARAHAHLSALVQPAKREMDALRDKARAADAILADAPPSSSSSLDLKDAIEHETAPDLAALLAAERETGVRDGLSLAAVTCETWAARFTAVADAEARDPQDCTAERPMLFRDAADAAVALAEAIRALSASDGKGGDR